MEDLSKKYHDNIKENLEKFRKKGVISTAEFFDVARYHSNLVKKDLVKEAMLENTEEFQKVVIEYIKRILKGQVTGVAYAVCIEKLAEKFDLKSELFYSYSVKTTAANYEKEKEEFKSKDRPEYVNNVYVEINGVSYEYYLNGCTDIEHLYAESEE